MPELRHRSLKLWPPPPSFALIALAAAALAFIASPLQLLIDKDGGFV